CFRTSGAIAGGLHGSMSAAAVAIRKDTRTWRALSLTGASSIASGLLAALAAKLIAVMFGPGSLALLGTLQQITPAALTTATLNGQTALVQGASALRGEEQADYLTTVRRLFGIAAILVGLVIVTAPAEIARLAGLPGQFAYLVRWLAI